MVPQENAGISNIKRFDSNLIQSLYRIKGDAEKQLDLLSQDHECGSPAELFEKARQALDHTLKQATRVIEMIQHFRETTQETAAQAAGLVGEVSVHDCVNEVIRAMNYEFPFHRITLLKIIPHDFPPLVIDQGHFESILFQLLYNARQALSGRHGIITLEAYRSDPAEKGSAPEERIYLRVSDTGPTLSEETLKQLFDPFFVAKNLHIEAGLNLYWIKKLVEINGGNITVRSDMNGTTFQLDFPRVHTTGSQSAA